MNGAGKTNLLDALYYLCMGKSYFGLADSHIVKHGEAFFRLEGHFDTGDKIEKIVAKVIPKKKKEIERDSVAYRKLSEHIGRLPVVIIAPDDTLLIREGSLERRRFLDNTLSQLNPHYLEALLAYHKILRQKTSALKKMAETKNWNASLIEIYNDQLVAPGKLIHQLRDAFITQFLAYFQETYNAIAENKEAVRITYSSQLNENDFSTMLQDNLEKERILERCCVGIQKDDLRFLLNDVPAKKFASQGQLKSFILALKLAQYKIIQAHKNRSPLLLLDDIFDKLDHARVESLLKLLVEKSYGQIFITDTDQNRMEAIIAKMQAAYAMYVVDGGVAELAVN